jgi:pimeloyl-ACP methyl ester carboxylesterase
MDSTSKRIKEPKLIQVALWLLGILVVAAVLGVIYQNLGTRRDAKRFPPIGKFVDLGTHQLHVVESGQGSPTIVLESGLMSTVLSWTELQHELARSFRVVSYDRAGLGWSELGPMPRTGDRIVDELHAMLQKARIAPPYVLVGHSFGGLTMPLFASRFPDEVAGMVLVDAVAPQEWDPPSEQDRRLSGIGANVCRRAAILARIGIIRFVAFLLTTRARMAAAHLVRLISRGTPADAGSVTSPWFSALPKDERDMAAVFWVQPKFALTIASQLENLSVSAAHVGVENLRDKPVVILSAKTASARRRAGHASMAKHLPRGEHVLANESNHWIMQQDRALVIRAVTRVIEKRKLAAEVATP